MQGQLLAAIAFGGALGAVARHLAVGQVALWAGPGFLFGTLAVNVGGSFAMGAIVELSALVWSPSPELRAFLTVGFLGAFTTFSRSEEHTSELQSLMRISYAVFCLKK